MINFTIEHRDGRWYVKSESGKPLGDYATEGEAKQRLRQVEAAKAAKGMSRFEIARGEDGRVASHVWDYVCVDGWDKKNGQYTEFTPETLGQMVDNFVARGDRLPYDFNHQSGYTEANGQPAPALAYCGALAIVWDGEVIKHGGARGEEYTPPDPSGRGNGLYSYRCEVTNGSAEYPLGEQLLPGFQYLSPMFTSEGSNRHGEDVGYQLIAIACTNTPWQPGTEMMSLETGKAGPVTKEKGPMQKLAKLAAFMTAKYASKFEDGADDKAVKQAVMAKMEDEGAAAMEEEAYGYDEQASHLEEMARLYEDAHFEEDDEAEPAHVTMRRMAARFRKMAKMNEGADAPAMAVMEPPHKEPDGDEAPKDMAAFAQSLGINAAGMKRAQLMDAIRAASVPAAKIPELVKASVANALAEEKAAQKTLDNKQRATQLMDALPKDYPGDRAALARLAERDPDEAAKLAQPFIKGVTAPAQLFSMLSRQGAPVGKSADARSEIDARPAARIVRTPWGNTAVVEKDAKFAEKVHSFAHSVDPTIKAKVDSHLHAAERTVMFNRLLAADKVVREEYPELAATADFIDFDQ